MDRQAYLQAQFAEIPKFLLYTGQLVNSLEFVWWKILSFKANNVIVYTTTYIYTNRQQRECLRAWYSRPNGIYTVHKQFAQVYKVYKSALYAADTAIYCHLYYSNIGVRQLQTHANSLQTYFQKWTINVEKTKIISFTRNCTYQPKDNTQQPANTRNNAITICEISRGCQT